MHLNQVNFIFCVVNIRHVYWQSTEGSLGAKNRVFGRKRFSMILRLELILPVVFYERKNIISYEKI